MKMELKFEKLDFASQSKLVSKINTSSPHDIGGWKWQMHIILATRHTPSRVVSDIEKLNFDKWYCRFFSVILARNENFRYYWHSKLQINPSNVIFDLRNDENM